MVALPAQALHAGHHGQLQISVVLFCCAWAKNHNILTIDILMIDAPLPEVPAALAPYFGPCRYPEGFLEAPDACGAVGLVDGDLTVRVGDADERIKLGLAGVRPEQILGTYWLDPEEPFRADFLADVARREKVGDGSGVPLRSPSIEEH